MAVAPFDERSSLGEVMALVVAAVVVGMLVWTATNSAGRDQIVVTVLGIVAGLVAVAAAVWYVGGRAARRAAGRSTTGVDPSSLPSIRSAQLLIAAGCALLVLGGVVSAIAMNDRSGRTFDAEVIAAEAVPGADLNRYTFEYRTAGGDVATTTFENTRHLRLGEQVFIDPVEDELVGAIDDPLFAVTVVLWMLAFGLITSGVRSYRWAQRCERLSLLVAERTSG
jgi:hypothetical protein